MHENIIFSIFIKTLPCYSLHVAIKPGSGENVVHVVSGVGSAAVVHQMDIKLIINACKEQF